MLAKGVHAAYASQAYELAADDKSLTITAPTKRINHRGDTLGGPLLTVRASSPMPDIVRINIWHHEETRGKHLRFPVNVQDDHEVGVCIKCEQAVLESGRLSVRFNKDAQWGFEFRGDGKPLTSSPSRGVGYVTVDGDQAYIHDQLALGVGENVYGFGERFTSFVKNGQVVETWNKDGGTGSDQAYKSVPFYMTNRGYGVFVNDPGAVSFEVASEKVSRVQFSVSGESLEYYVIYGPTPKDVLTKYAALTGRPALPPAWTFGLWLTTSFTTSYDEQTVTSFIDGMAERDLPLHVFHFDCFWMREYRWCDFEWDKRVFPDPAGMLRRLKDRGLKICVWINPYIAQLSPLFAEGAKNGYLIKRPDGRVWQTDEWQPGMAIVDFTNPDACAWFASKLGALLDMGVNCFKTDFGERIPTDVVYHDGSDPERMHNFYTYLYNKTVFDLLREHRGEGEAVLFARSATAGCQQFPVHWGGDCNSNFESMAESLRGGLSLGMSGFGFWSHDIGGFEGTPPAPVYKRWIAFGLMSSHSRLHGSGSYRIPWAYDDEACDVLRHFTKLKCVLMPYIYQQACIAHTYGTPLMRPMLLEYVDDPTCAFLDRQYMLGDSLLIAPVFSEGGDVEYYLPKGIWTDFATGREISGPRWVRETHGYRSMPMFAKPNSVIAVGAESSRPDYDFADGVVFRAYNIQEGCDIQVIVPDLQGDPSATLHVARRRDRIELSYVGQGRPWQFLLVGKAAVANVVRGFATETEVGLLITPNDSVSSVTIDLHALAAASNGHKELAAAK